MAGNLPLIVVLGATAVGKTEVAIALANTLDGEIIGADSRQVYQHMDIGTAKPTPEQRAAAPHHLVDFVPPDDTLSLATYQRAAYATIDDIHQRGKVPLLVGGTGQYITAVVEGWSIPEVPPNDALRAQLEAEAAEDGSPVLYERLRDLDADAAEKIHPNNLRRIVRALEVCITTGERFSDLQRKKPPPYHILQHGFTMERERLYHRADLRVDKMMEAGFLDEVRTLLDMGYERSLPSMTGLGYLQLAAYLLDGQPLDDAVADTKTATRHFIKRQYTWFRGHDNGIRWHDVEKTSITDFIERNANWLRNNS